MRLRYVAVLAIATMQLFFAGLSVLGDGDLQLTYWENHLFHGEALYSEDFSAETSWEVGGSEEMYSAVENGTYITHLRKADCSLISFCRCGPFEDFRFDVTAQRVPSAESEAIGDPLPNVECLVALHSQDIYGQGALIFSIRKDETVVRAYADHEYTWIATSCVGADFTEPRRISVVSFDEKCILYVDGTALAAVPDGGFLPGDIGLGAGTQTSNFSLAFDDVRVRRIWIGNAFTLDGIESSPSDGPTDLCAQWPASLAGVSADSLVVCGVALGISEQELLDRLEGESYDVDRSGPLPQYVYRGLSYTISAGGHVQGIAIPADALPSHIRQLIEDWDESALRDSFGEDSAFHSLPGLVDYIETPLGIKAVRMGGSVSVILTLTEEQLSEIEIDQTTSPSNDQTPDDLTYDIHADGSGDFPTLDQALESVPAGSTLRLGAGIFLFDETLHVSQSLQIVGNGSDTTTISSSAEGNLLVVVGDDTQLSLEGIAFVHTGDSPADLVVCDGRSLRAVRCSLGGGIASPDGELAVGAGIYTLGGCTAELLDCTSANAVGFIISGAGDSLIRSCTASSNSLHGVVWGTDGTIEDSEFSDNGLRGIAIAEDATVEIHNTTCCDNGDVGIHFAEGATGRVTGSTCNDNRIGMYIEAEDVSIETSSASGNETVGILFAGGSAGVCRGNTCQRNDSGIMTVETAHPTIEDNLCSQNEATGIRIEGSSTPEVSDNRLTDNGFFGILCSGQSSATVTDNASTANDVAGIAVYERASGVVSGNTASENAQAGIHVSGSSTARIHANTCNDNEGFGILCDEESASSVEDNICNGNVTVGIAFFNSAGGTAAGNTCRNNDVGIFVAETSEVVVRSNTCTANIRAQIADTRSPS